VVGRVVSDNVMSHDVWRVVADGATTRHSSWWGQRSEASASLNVAEGRITAEAISASGR